jgi:hypothetical protein
MGGHKLVGILTRDIYMFLIGESTDRRVRVVSAPMINGPKEMHALGATTLLLTAMSLLANGASSTCFTSPPQFFQ